MDRMVGTGGPGLPAVPLAELLRATAEAGDAREGLAVLLDLAATGLRADRVELVDRPAAPPDAPSVPVSAGGRTLGHLLVVQGRPWHPTAGEREFAEVAAGLAGQLLLRARTEERQDALRRESAELTARAAALLALARTLAGARTPADVARALAEHRYGGGVVSGGIGMLDEERRHLRVLGTFGGPSWGAVPLTSRLPFVRSALTGRTMTITRDEVVRLSPEGAAWMDQRGARNAIAVPLHDDRGAVGSISVQVTGEVIDPQVVRHLEAVAALTGQALGRAMAQEQAQAAVEELQRALLPRSLPEPPGTAVRAGYQASGRVGEIGGDFYDVVARPDGSLLLLVGDVQGHDLVASSVMAQLRAVLHSLASDGQPPAEILTRADDFLVSAEVERLVTVVAVEVDPAARLAAVSLAGHLPPILLVSGAASIPDLVPDLPLGLADESRSEHVLALPPAAQLLLVTDGLIERKHEAITRSLARLAQALQEQPGAGAGSGPSTGEALQERIAWLMQEASHETGDDAAVLLLQLTDADPAPPVRFGRTLPPVPRTAPTARRWVEAGLARLGLPEPVPADALVVLTELVTNATRAASRPLTVTVDFRGSCLDIGVQDDTHRRPHPRRAAADDLDGRGMTIVEALAARWWIEDHPDGGKTVWARLDVPGVAGP